MNLALLAIMKNESHIVSEWISHYTEEGVDNIYIIDNGSTDNSQKIAVSNGAIVCAESLRYAQAHLYNKCFEKTSIKNSDWIIVADLDEFIYARREFKTIKNFLESLSNDVSQVMIPWKLFGSSSYVCQPINVISSFIQRAKYDKKNQGMLDQNLCFSKSIVRTSALSKLQIHQHEISCGSIIRADGMFLVPEKEGLSTTNEEKLENSFLHCNHYAIQSLDWFLEVKSTRGDVNQAALNKIRDIDYFRSFDYSDIVDSELCIKKLKVTSKN